MNTSSRRSLLQALLVAALLGACSGGGGNGREPTGTHAGASSTADETLGSSSFAVTGTDVQAMAAKAPPFPADVSAGVKAGLDRWLGDAVVAPLRTGKPSSGLEAVFTAPALGRISVPGPERGAVLEEGAPLSGKVHQERADAKLTALSAPGGEIVLVTAQVDVRHTVTSGGGAVDVVRSGELVLVPDGGTWRIDAFDMVTRRDTRTGGN